MHKYVKRAEAAGVGWPLSADWDDARLEAELFPPNPAAELPDATAEPARQPDFAAIHEHIATTLTGKVDGDVAARHGRGVEALQTQQNDPAMRELTFLERLGLMIDHQWN